MGLSGGREEQDPSWRPSFSFTIDHGLIVLFFSLSASCDQNLSWPSWKGFISSVDQVCTSWKPFCACLDSEHSVSGSITSRQPKVICQPALKQNMEIWSLNSKLLLAIQDNDLQVAKEILSHDSMDPDVRFAMGYGNQIPAICLCVERGLYQMAKLLIDSGSSVNSSDDLGYTPLHFAASHQFTDLVKLLLANRADPNAASNYLHTPLHLACQQSSIGQYSSYSNSFNRLFECRNRRVVVRSWSQNG